MSVASGSATNPYSYLQSLLQPQPQTGGAKKAADPLAALFAGVTGASNGGQSESAGKSGTSSPPVSGGPALPLSPSTLAALISLQGQQSSKSGGDGLSSLFGKFDTDGDGQVSKSEFESASGGDADVSEVKALFGEIDDDGDGAISKNELGSAIQQAHTRDGGAGPGGQLADLLSSKDAAGATSQTTTNDDGSATTTITYADGTTITMMSPAKSSDAASGETDNGDGDTSQGQNGVSDNGPGNAASLLERLIKLQAQVLTQAAQTALKLAPI